jgi:hypothetical protein
MTGIFVPILLVLAAIIAALVTYRNIRRGGARFYTLEREIVLRRAAFTLTLSVLLFLASFALMFYQRQSLLDTLVPPSEQTAEEGTNGLPAPQTTPTLLLEQFPPTPLPTSLTPEATITPTPVVCRAMVDGTGGNGLYLRSEPQGEELVILPDGTLLTVLDDEPVETGGVTWRKVRAIGGEEGWAADIFLTIRAPCGED